jgi:hypothetical protein
MDTSITIAHALIWETKSVDMGETKTVRVFTNSPDRVALQIRSRNGLSNTGHAGKPRNLIAHANLTREEFLSLRDSFNEAATSRGWVSE